MHYAMAAIHGLGLRGIKNKMKLPYGPIGSPGVTRETLVHLPTSLEAATAQFMRKGSVAREVFGDFFVDHFGGTREHELTLFRRAVTDWESESPPDTLIQCAATWSWRSNSMHSLGLLRQAGLLPDLRGDVVKVGELELEVVELGADLLVRVALLLLVVDVGLEHLGDVAGVRNASSDLLGLLGRAGGVERLGGSSLVGDVDRSGLRSAAVSPRHTSARPSASEWWCPWWVMVKRVLGKQESCQTS